MSSKICPFIVLKKVSTLNAAKTSTVYTHAECGPNCALWTEHGCSIKLAAENSVTR